MYCRTAFHRASNSHVTDFCRLLASLEDGGRERLCLGYSTVAQQAAMDGARALRGSNLQ